MGKREKYNTWVCKNVAEEFRRKFGETITKAKVLLLCEAIRTGFVCEKDVKELGLEWLKNAIKNVENKKEDCGDKVSVSVYVDETTSKLVSKEAIDRLNNYLKAFLMAKDVSLVSKLSRKWAEYVRKRIEIIETLKEEGEK